MSDSTPIVGVVDTGRIPLRSTSFWGELGTIVSGKFPKIHHRFVSSLIPSKMGPMNNEPCLNCLTFGKVLVSIGGYMLTLLMRLPSLKLT